MNIADELRRDGIAVLRRKFRALPEFLEHLAARPVYRNHVRQGKPSEGPLGSWPWMCHDMHDVLRAPGFLEEAVSLAPLAQDYLGMQPLLYSLNAFYTEPGAQPKPDIQQFHRDADDSRFVALFLYCTDVLDDGDGPHQFVRGSHRGGDGADTVSIHGVAGTLFLADTRGLHRGLVPRRRRMVAWARFGVSDPPAAFVWDGLTPLPAVEMGQRYPSDPVLRQTVRLVVA